MQQATPPEQFLSWWPTLSATEVAFIAVVGAFIGAAIAATASLVVATINAWNARRMAHDAAVRAYRIEMLRPVLADVEHWIEVLDRISDGADLSIAFDTAKRPSNRVIRVTPDDELNKFATRFAFWRYVAWSLLCGELAPHVLSTERKWLIDRAFDAALAFRESIENQIFGTMFKKDIARNRAQYHEKFKEQLVTLCARIELSAEGYPADTAEEAVRKSVREGVKAKMDAAERQLPNPDTFDSSVA